MALMFAPALLCNLCGVSLLFSWPLRMSLLLYVTSKECPCPSWIIFAVHSCSSHGPFACPRLFNPTFEVYLALLVALLYILAFLCNLCGTSLLFSWLICMSLLFLCDHCSISVPPSCPSCTSSLLLCSSCLALCLSRSFRVALEATVHRLRSACRLGGASVSGRGARSIPG